jgi:hypothetical protein
MTMKKRLIALGACAVLSVAGVAVMLYARDAEVAKKADVAGPKTAFSKITAVTVYPNSALVTREVDVPAGTGTIELVVTPLPQRTISSSLYSESADGIRVLTTRFRSRPVEEDTREEVRKIQDEAKKLVQAAQKIQGDMKACQENMAFLAKVETFASGSTAQATEKGKLDSTETISLAKFVMDGRAEKNKELVALQQQLDDNKEKAEFLARKLRDMTAGSVKVEEDAVIVVDKTNADPGKVKLNYLVDAAAWRPQYKLRAGKDAKDAVQIECLAAIIQQTGEDWQGVDVTLSTAQPMLNAAPPDLKMLAVAIVPKSNTPPGLVANPGFAPGKDRSGGAQYAAGPRGPGDNTVPNPQGLASAGELQEAAGMLRKQAQQELNKRNADVGNEIWNFAGALDQACDLILSPEEKLAKGIVVKTSQREGPSVTYHLSAKLSMPSRNDEQVIEVSRLTMAPEYYYKAVPVLTPHVYRQANLTNTSKYVLLPGEATMYNGADFVGRMNLPLVAVGEQFTVGFGTEPALQINRQMVDKSRTMQGGNQVLKFEYRMLVSSYKPEKVKLQIWDRLPQAENETLNVTLIKATPDISKDPLYQREDRPHNLLRWDVDVDPKMNGENAMTLTYEFKLELDKQMTIGSFQSK